MVVWIDETFENFVHSITTFHTFNCKTLRYVVYANYFDFVVVVKNLYSLQNSQFCTLDVVFEAVRCMYTPPTVATPKKLHIDSLNKQERVSPSLYGHYNTIVFQCFNTNSKRSLSPLFFHRETQQTRDRLHWCIDHWFSDSSILWLCLNIATTTTGHMQRALNPCASQNLQRKRKRGLSEVKIAVFVRKWKKWLVVYCCDGRYSLGGERSQHKIFTAWFSTTYFAYVPLVCGIFAGIFA